MYRVPDKRVVPLTRKSESTHPIIQTCKSHFEQGWSVFLALSLSSFFR